MSGSSEADPEVARGRRGKGEIRLCRCLGTLDQLSASETRSTLERVFTYPAAVGTWHDPDLGRPIAAPLERCAELLGVDLATVRKVAVKVEPYVRADGTRIWSLMQLERQLRPQAYGRRRGGFLDRRRTLAADA
jgi:hypothetical protein